MVPLDQLRILLDVAIAMVLGSIIGFERERRDKPAGFRTNMVVAGASALFLILGRSIAGQMGASLPEEALGVDPTRIIHAIIVGVSFVGAGTIIKSREEETIHNLTTAATLLLSSAAGMSVALRLYILAAGVTALALIVNTIVKKIYG